MSQRRSTRTKGIPVPRLPISQSPSPTDQRNRAQTSVVSVYGVPVLASTLDKALDSASTIRDSTEHGGKLEYTEDTTANLNDSMDETASICVQWDGRDDREDSRQMSKIRKWVIAVVLSLTAFQIELSSSIWSQSSRRIIQEFMIPQVISTLGVTLYMVGIAVGPLLGPISEFAGRKPTFTVASLVYIGLQLLTVLGTTIDMMLIGRFFTGFSGGTIITTAFSILGDLFNQEKMGSPMIMLVMAPLMGPVLAPALSSFVSELLSFQWVFRIMCIWSGVMAVLNLFIIPETYAPVLLVRKAKRIRRNTKNPNFYAPLELDRKNMFKVLFIGIHRPFRMLVTDAVIAYLAIYGGLLAGVIYSFFTAFPVVFTTVYQFKPQMQGISFLGIAAGMLLASLTQPFWTRCYRKLTKKSNGQDEAEFWLPELLIGGLFVPAGLFLFGWTDVSWIHPIVPIIGVGIFGFGALLCFTSIYAYIVDGYRRYAASGVAAIMFVTGIFAGVFPLFAGDLMYRRVGIHWSPTIFGLITAACIPIPVVLFVNGTTWRDKSRYSSNTI